VLLARNGISAVYSQFTRRGEKDVSVDGILLADCILLLQGKLDMVDI
jgi:hypothetical protein